MKRKSVQLWIYLSVLFLTISSGCDENNSGEKKLTEEEKFLEELSLNPIVIDGVTLAYSNRPWRLSREEAHYNDGEVEKEYDFNFMSDPEFIDYKEFWYFGQEKVLMTFEGNRADKNWDDYFELFNQTFDLPNKTVAIYYVYDGGEKTYTRNWKITSLTGSELILTDENPEQESFYQMTFVRTE